MTPANTKPLPVHALVRVAVRDITLDATYRESTNVHELCLRAATHDEGYELTTTAAAYPGMDANHAIIASLRKELKAL